MSVSAFWQGKVVVVTGASSGIGAALATEVDLRGGNVALVARRLDKLEEVASSLRRESLVVVGDVTVRADVERAAEAAMERFGHIDVWVNNAGRGITRSVMDLTDHDVDSMFRDNVKSALYGMQVAVSHMRPRGTGHVVNVSSMLARSPFVTFRSAYSASKAALNSLTESLRADLSRDAPGIKVACVMPGVVSTDFGLNALNGGADSRTFPGAQPADEVARIIADAVEAGRSGDVYTRVESLDRVVHYLRDLAGQGTP